MPVWNRLKFDFHRYNLPGKGGMAQHTVNTKSSPGIMARIKARAPLDASDACG